MSESKTVEYKKTVTNTFLKTVSAFANYGGGCIYFGIDDNGKTIGLADLDEVCLAIENKINDSIKPQPEYLMTINKKDSTITLEIIGGLNKPYYYKSKAYKRNDTATIEVDTLELTRLILAGKNTSFEELPYSDQDLSFQVLEAELKEKIGIEAFDLDVLKTLNLYSEKEGYNNAAALFADVNDFPGIDMARFGETISVILKRVTLGKTSILSMYRKALEIYRDYYQYEEVSGSLRQTRERIPEEAFREAVANALIHRTWDVKAAIRISMFDDRIEITSPGGLPEGMTELDYVNGRFSQQRNPIIGNVLYRLKIVEMFGTGIQRIKEVYSKSDIKPSFKAYDSSIQVVLPVMVGTPELTYDERMVYALLEKTRAKPISEITSSEISFGRSKVTALLKSMAKKGIVTIEGNGRGTKYHI